MRLPITRSLRLAKLREKGARNCRERRMEFVRVARPIPPGSVGGLGVPRVRWSQVSWLGRLGCGVVLQFILGWGKHAEARARRRPQRQACCRRLAAGGAVATPRRSAGLLITARMRETYAVPTVAANETRFAEFAGEWRGLYAAMICGWESVQQEFVPFSRLPARATQGRRHHQRGRLLERTLPPSPTSAVRRMLPVLLGQLQRGA